MYIKRPYAKLLNNNSLTCVKELFHCCPSVFSYMGISRILSLPTTRSRPVYQVEVQLVATQGMKTGLTCSQGALKSVVSWSCTTITMTQKNL